MPTPLSGPGLGLPAAQNLYPAILNNAPYNSATSRITLAAGDELPIPAGTWFVNTGMYCTLEYLDPMTLTWSMGSNAGWIGGHVYVKSDGFNVRVANRLGCPISAVVAAYGSAYVQGTTTITATPGTSTWVPIIGGQLSATINSNGAGYGVAPIVFIPPPPPAANNANGVGGIQATAYAVIASGTVSGITFTNPGAGYPSTVTGVILPNPTDPNINVGITNASVTFTLTGSGSITGALCTQPGAPIANGTVNNLSLTLSGAGSSGSLTGNVLQTVVGATVTGIGVGFGASTNTLISTVGGVPPAGSVSNNPDALYLAWRPRPAQIVATSDANGTLTATGATIYDGGLFLTNTAPTPVYSPRGLPTVAPTIALTMGSRADIVTIQPAP